VIRPLRLKLEPASPIPMYLQIIEQVRHGIAIGTLQADEEMPSVRALASKHLINPNTVARAYLELERDGLLSKRRGAGTYVSASATSLSEAHRIRAVRELLDKALAAAIEYGLSPKQVRALVDERLAASKEKSA
jgi:GntR family transcriptional regulator